ncbi:MAG: CPBP family intramembrane glutamic endopeptidase [Actinomycetota bacterium]
MSPVAELKAFVRASLLTPVERDHTEPDSAFQRRRLVAAATLVVGAAALALALRIEPGNALFYPATLGVAVVWTVGALASGRLYRGQAHTRDGSTGHPVMQAFLLGAGLLIVFLAGAALVAQMPFLRDQVQGLLDHARYGSLAIVAVITAINGVAEELFFRGGLYSAVGRNRPVLVTTVVYALATVATGVVLLVFAAVALGTLVGLQRRVTGGVLGPIVTHLTWSLGMLFLLPPALNLWS